MSIQRSVAEILRLLTSGRHIRGLRVLVSVASLAAALLVSQGARAVVFVVDDITVSEGTFSGTHVLVPVGATVTVGARIADPTATPISGIGASYYGWSPSILSFISGTTVASIFHTVCPVGSSGTGGMDNLLPGVTVQSIVSVGGPFAGTPRVRTLKAIAFPAKAAHVDDPGLDGTCGNGDAQMRLTFQALADGETNLIIGTGDDRGDVIALANGSVVQATNATVTVTVPEPGITLALSAGLSLLLAVGRVSRNARGPRAGQVDLCPVSGGAVNPA